MSYWVATVYLDHYSDLSYVHLQHDNSGRETLKTKIAFEHYALKHIVIVQRCHADNGRFADREFGNDTKAQWQMINSVG